MEKRSRDQTRSAISAEQVLRAFARSRGIRVRREMIIYFHLQDVATLNARFVEQGKRVELKASERHLMISIKAEIPIFFSVGAKFPPLLIDQYVGDTAVNRLPVFAGEGFETQVRQWLQNTESAGMLDAFALRTGESLHVARNGTMLIAHPDRDIAQELSRLHAFTASAETEPEPAPSTLLPTGFEDLEEIARGWALPDDAEREERLDLVSRSYRSRLRKLLVPRLADIDRYLDQQEQPLSEEAQRLQTLGELGAELRVRTN